MVRIQNRELFISLLHFLHVSLGLFKKNNYFVGKLYFDIKTKLFVPTYNVDTRQNMK